MHWLNDTSCLVSFPRHFIDTIQADAHATKDDTTDEAMKEEGEIEDALPSQAAILLKRLQTVRTCGAFVFLHAD